MENRNAAYLSKALFLLLERKPYEEITVGELLRKAGVSRPTFYRYYRSLDDILEKSLESLTALLPEYSFSRKDLLRNAIVLGLRSLLGIRNELFILAQRGLFPRLCPYLGKRMKESFSTFVPPLSEEKVDFLIGGQSLLLLNWARSGFQKPLEEMADLLYDLTLKVLS